MFNLKLFPFIYLLYFPLFLVGQKQFGKNIPSFERKQIHFGFAFSGLYSTYNYDLKPFATNDSITTIRISGGPGIGLNIPIISFNFHPSVHLRIIPSLSFQETTFEYQQIKNGTVNKRETRTGPVYGNVQILLKLNTKRLTNFSAYALGGLGYSYDFSNDQDVKQNSEMPIVKLKQHDLQYHVGGGFDFYFPYFKLAAEIKLTNGMRNLLIQDDTFFTSPLESLKSQVWWFSITFEG